MTDVYKRQVLIGLIALAAWPLSVATGREFGLGITGPSAVSYTHLDVYKRQAPYR